MRTLTLSLILACGLAAGCSKNGTSGDMPSGAGDLSNPGSPDLSMPGSPDLRGNTIDLSTGQQDLTTGSGDLRAAGDLRATGDMGSGSKTVLVGPGGNLIFSPATLTVHVGDTVTWVWQSSGHNVISGSQFGNPDGKFCSPNNTNCTAEDVPTSNTGATYQHTFNQAGNFPYYCGVHVFSAMTGEIDVM